MSEAFGRKDEGTYLGVCEEFVGWFLTEQLHRGKVTGGGVSRQLLQQRPAAAAATGRPPAAEADAAAAELPGDIPGFSDKDAGGATTALRKFLGASGQPHVGYNAYPVVGLNVKAAESGDAPLGITLKQTLAYDENDENLLRYPLKKDELQAVLVL